MKTFSKSLSAAFIAMALTSQAATQLAVRVTNKLQQARPNCTVELSARDISSLGDLQKIHVRDANGKEVLAQAIDTDFDSLRKPDILIFQADFAPGEEKEFKLSAGAKHVYKKEQFKAHGRFVRERFDDFAWENDRIAHRMYGKALETWQGEPLTSSTVDIWTKRVPQMVIDDWYMVDNYHNDTGQGADFYSAGTTRGCGGNGLWVDNKLWTSRNFVNSRVLADGPIRVMFELVYEPFDVNGKKVSEVKQITLDAGNNMDHFQSVYAGGELGASLCGLGLKKVSGEKKEYNGEQGWLLSWEAVEKNHGMQGVAIVTEPKIVEKETEDKQNNLLLVKVGPDKIVSYWAGFGWDKSGQFADAEAWKAYVQHFAERVQSPLIVKVASE